MTKRLKKSEFMMAYMIIITLACTIGGFFFGAHYMKNKIETAQAQALEAQKQEAEKERLLQEQKLYSEQDFIRFYYAVYSPVLDLKKAHFDVMNQWGQMDKKAQEQALKQLSQTAEATLKSVDKTVSLQTAPLLLQAQAQFKNSVRAYLDSMDQVRTDQNSNALTPGDISNRMTPFHENWLKAQELVYQSFATWESAYVVKTPLPQALPEKITIEQWKTYPFHYRNYVTAVTLSHDHQWRAFNPEDLTVRLDSLFSSNDAQALGIHDVHAAVRLLFATDAIHPGDFKQLHSRIYSDLPTPEVPLFK